MESNLQSLVEAGQEDNDELRTRVYVETMGPETHNRVRGYGHGVTPDMVSYASSTSSTSDSSRRSSKSAMAVLLTQNNELKMREENYNRRISNLEVKIDQSNQLFAMLLQKFQPQPPYSPGTQQSGQGQPPQQSNQNQPPLQTGQSQHPHAFPYAGYNQQPPFPMYPMPSQPVSYMQQLSMPYAQHPPMQYMQQPPPHQGSVYRPEMAPSGGYCPEVPAGGFSGMLATGFDVDLTRIFGSDQGSHGGHVGEGSHGGHVGEGSHGVRGGEGSHGVRGGEGSGRQSGSDSVE